MPDEDRDWDEVFRDRELQVQRDAPLGMPFEGFIAVVALTPFITALATTLGNAAGAYTKEKLALIALRLPGASRRLEHRLMLNMVGGVDEPSQLDVSAEEGARIRITSEIPERAFAILLGIDFSRVSDLGEVPPSVRWVDSKWCAFSIRDGKLVEAAWDDAINEWKRR